MRPKKEVEPDAAAAFVRPRDEARLMKGSVAPQTSAATIRYKYDELLLLLVVIVLLLERRVCVCGIRVM
jgi:hypothetical protein